MEMISNKSNRMSKQIFAVAILFGMSATTCTAQEAAVDDGSEFDTKKIYLNEETFANDDFIKSSDPSAIGLHFLSNNSLITHGGKIFLTGEGAVGLRLDGINNRLVIERDASIDSVGKGLWIAYGNDNRVTVAGNIFSSGNAVEFNIDPTYAGEFDPSTQNLSGALVDEFTLSGTLSGGQNAIFIGRNAFVRNIEIDTGAKIFGDIRSNHRGVSDDFTNLNINDNFDYDGNIIGANSINMHINAGTMNFSGTANVANVDVARGAKFFGNMLTAKNFINHGTIGSISPEKNLIINGNLTSDGFLQKVSGGSKGLIIVHGAANVEGSTVTTDSLLPDETATVLIADSVTGNIKNPAGNPVPISAMLSATGAIVGNTLTVTTYESNNLGSMNAAEAQTFKAMQNMYENLDETNQNEMRELYNLEPNQAKETLSQIGSNDAAQVMSVAQQSTAVDKFISNRIIEVFAPDIDINIHPMNFADDDDSSAVPVKVKVPTRQEENFWLNYMKNWGSLRGGTDYHGSAIVGGYDRAFGQKWRAGIFATYGTIGYGADSSRATVRDTRLGLYAGYHNRASDVYLYLNGGQLRNSLHRGLSSLGLSTKANYKSHIIEFGGEYKYDLQPKRTWHVSPFVNVQVSYLRQNSYNESGAGIYNQHVDANSNTYFAAQVGLDLKRYYRKGMFGMRLGVKRGFTGADPELKISYEGDGNRSYRLRQQRDKTHFVFSLRGENEFYRGWYLGADAELQLGENDKDVTASLTLRRTW